MSFLAPASALLLVFSGAVLAAETPPPADYRNQSRTPDNSIGVARMLADGSIMVGVAGPGSGDRAQAILTLQPGDTQYQPLIDHVGGLKPGETKLIPPWPDSPPPQTPPPATSER